MTKYLHFLVKDCAKNRDLWYTDIMLTPKAVQEKIADAVGRCAEVEPRCKAEARDLIRYTLDGGFETHQSWQLSVPRLSRKQGYRLEAEVSMQLEDSASRVDDAGNRVSDDKLRVSVRASGYGDLTPEDARALCDLTVKACELADSVSEIVSSGVTRVLMTHEQIVKAEAEQKQRDLKKKLVEASNIELVMKCARVDATKSQFSADASLIASLKSAGGRVEAIHTIGNPPNVKTYRIVGALVTARGKGITHENAEITITRTL